MLSADDIEAFKDDAEVFDRVVERVERGVPAGRELHASEVIPFIRMAVQWRASAAALSRHIHETALASMGLD